MATNKTQEEKEIVKDVVVEDTPVETTPAEVTVSVDQMQSVLDRMDELEKSNKALREIASSTRLQEAEDGQTVDKRPRIHFKLMDGKPIIGWPEKAGEEKKSEIIFNPNTNSPMGEILKSVYYFVDGTKTDLIDQLKFTRLTDITYARVVEDLGDSGLVEFEDPSILPNRIEINKKFWNA